MQDERKDREHGLCLSLLVVLILDSQKDGWSALHPGQAREWQRELQVLGSAGAKACGKAMAQVFVLNRPNSAGTHGKCRGIFGELHVMKFMKSPLDISIFRHIYFRSPWFSPLTSGGPKPTSSGK